MSVFTPLQTATGGSPAVVALTLGILLITAALALIVAYLLVRGYQQNRDRARLYLGIGLVLLTTSPIILQFVLANTGVSPGIRSAAANTSKLIGLVVILYAIYGVTQSHQRPRSDRDRNPNLHPDHSEEDSP